jgi:hypothetical protein
MICTFCERNFSGAEIEQAVPLPSSHNSHSYLVRFKNGQIHQFRRTQLPARPAGAFVMPPKPPEPESGEPIIEIDFLPDPEPQPEPRKSVIKTHKREVEEN